MLTVKSVNHRFGGLEVLRDVSVEINEGELVGLIGPNGAGKTTLFNVISGFLHPDAGQVYFRGQEVTGIRPDRLAAKGLTRTFQGARVFPKLSVRESLQVACHLRPGGARDRQANLVEEALSVFELGRFADELAGALPSGMMRVLGIAMAISTGASMLLLDEPAAGLSGEEMEHLLTVIKRLNESGTTLLVVEHNLQFLMTLVDRAIVLDSGMLIAQGTPNEVTSDPRVIEAYLGAYPNAEN